VLVTLHFAKYQKVCHEGVQDAFGLLFYTNFFLFNLSLVSARRKCLDKKKNGILEIGTILHMCFLQVL
jgi:hypothetical protein